GAEVLRREERLEQGIIDGTLTAWVQIPDLRVGDIVDYASIRVMRPMAPAGERGFYSTLEWGVPVQMTRVVALWPKGWPMVTGPLPDHISHVEAVLADGTTRHEWQRLNHLPDRWEENTPVGMEPTALLRVSADPDWGTLSAAMTPYYAADYPLPPDWQARVEAIAAASPDPGARAIAALRLVQDELRYVSLSVGAGGYLARPPQEVIAGGFGDCKDKALLLVVMLRQLGIAATVALTDLDAGHALDREPPLIGAFDHAIVRITLAGQVHYVDPTASHQGGDFATATPPDYGFALPLAGPDQTALEPLPAPPEQSWSTDVTEAFSFGKDGVLLEVRSVYRGGAADGMRQRWATTPASRITEDYLEFYQGRYPGLILRQEMQMTDDRAQNRLEMVERYRLPRSDLEGTALEKSFPVAAEDFASNLPDRVKAPRRAPLDAGGPAVFRHRVLIRDAPMEFLPPKAEVIVNPAFRFMLNAGQAPAGGLDLRWEFRRSGAIVAPEQAARVIEDGNLVYDLTWFTWDVSPEGAD
ncbi:MAG: transglutaminase domain-containing protein, partial [Paracoccaceae bacterium]